MKLCDVKHIPRETFNERIQMNKAKRKELDVSFRNINEAIDSKIEELDKQYLKELKEINLVAKKGLAITITALIISMIIAIYSESPPITIFVSLLFGIPTYQFTAEILRGNRLYKKEAKEIRQRNAKSKNQFNN